MSNDWLLSTRADLDLIKAMDAMGLKGKFTREDVRKAFQKRVVQTQCHPDCPGGGDPKRYKNLIDARDELLRSFDIRRSATYGSGHKQGPMRDAKGLSWKDKVLAILNESRDLDEAIEKVRAMK